MHCISICVYLGGFYFVIIAIQVNVLVINQFMAYGDLNKHTSGFSKLTNFLWSYKQMVCDYCSCGFYHIFALLVCSILF
jgi:hypothetical protein